VPRRVSLPTADDLFRPTDEQARVRAVPDAPEQPEQEPAAEEAVAAPHKPSGRVRHDEKMTVYVTSGELLDLEHARLALRRDHGLALDRGRLVREALALVLRDFDEKGHKSVLVRRLIEE
jgi:hypothetical protein